MPKETLLIDYSESRPKLTDIKHSGYVGAIRYLSHTPAKNLTETEAKALHDESLPILLVWETTATRAGEGAAAGKADRVDAEAQAKALGYPKGCPIFYAVDEQVSAVTVSMYFAGVSRRLDKIKKAVGLLPWKPSIYGSDVVVDGILAKGHAAYGWQTAAWSGGRLSKEAAIYQRVGHDAPAVPGGGYDENVVLKEIPMWGKAGVVKIAPPASPPKPKPKPRTLPVKVRAAIKVLKWLDKYGKTGKRPLRATAIAKLDRVDTWIAEAKKVGREPAKSELHSLVLTVDDDNRARVHVDGDPIVTARLDGAPRPTSPRVAGHRGRAPKKPVGERFAIAYLHDYLNAALPTVKYPIDVTGGITDWQMLGNGPDPTCTTHPDGVGDCTFAGRQHYRMAKAAFGHDVEKWETANQLVAEYLKYDHGQDNGANIADLLLKWYDAGLVEAFAPVDHTSPTQVNAAMAAFKGVYCGVNLTDDADQLFEQGREWTTAQGQRPDPSLGHCIVKVRATAKKDGYVTWGAEQDATKGWSKACLDEAWVIITKEDAASGLINMAALKADIAALPGHLGG